MFACIGCGRTAAADPETGYDADELCPECREAEVFEPEELVELEDLDTLEEDADYQYERWRERWQLDKDRRS
jgi:hypothetical protein